MNNLFKEEFKRNNILDNSSLSYDTLLLHNFEGDESLNIISIGELYGMICINVKGVSSSITIKLDDIRLIEITSDGEYSIPIRFTRKNILQLVGICDSILLMVQNARFENYNSREILPQDKIIINMLGDKKVFAYLDVEDVLNNDIVYDQVFENLLYVQTYNVGENYYLGKIIKTDNVYYCSSVDNYTNQILICDDADSILFLNNSDQNLINFLYIKMGNLYLKTLNTNNELSEEMLLGFNSDFLATKLLGAQLYKGSSCVFGVINDKNNLDLYVLKNSSSIDKIYHCKGKKI